VQRHTALRGFDLSTGAAKIRWNLPGDNSTCNDFAIGPDKAPYITDTANSKIYKLPAGASNSELLLEHHEIQSFGNGLTLCVTYKYEDPRHQFKYRLTQQFDRGMVMLGGKAEFVWTSSSACPDD